MAVKVVEPCSVRLQKALSIRNMKQSELSEKTKIPKSAISHYLSGSFEPKQDRLFVIARALSVDPVWLMGFDVPMEPEPKTSPSQPELTEVEGRALEILRKIPEGRQQAALDLLQAVLKMQ